MFHPLMKLVTTQPQLVAHHIGAYANLASAQASDALLALRGRAVLGLTAAALLVLGLLLAGVALLLTAVTPLAEMPAPWLLAVAPAVPLLAAAGSWLALRRRPWAWSLDPLREQLAADAALLAEAGDAR